VASRPLIEIKFGNVGFCGERKAGEPGEKPSEQGREPTTNVPTYDTGTGNRTRATLVGGECSHHCAIPAPSLRHPCAIPAPSLRHPCAIPAPTRQLILGDHFSLFSSLECLKKN